MPKIIDPDLLNQATEVVIDTGAKTIQLLVAGNLVATPTGAQSGVTGKAFYSFLKEEWEADANLAKFRFPIKMIYEAQFIWQNGWTPADDTTRSLIRDAGFLEIDGRENACLISLGTFNDATVTAYYTNVAGLDQTSIAFGTAGELNENIQIKGPGGTPDNSGYFKAFLRADQDVYDEYNLLSEQDLSALTYQAYRIPLASDIDNDAVDNYAQVGTTGTGSISGVNYNQLSIDYIQGTGYNTATVRSYALNEIVQDLAGRWYRCTTAGTADATDINDLGAMGGAGTAVFTTFEGERLIGTTYYAFNRIIDAQDTGLTSARIREIHSYCQYQLSLGSDINANTTLTGFGVVNGNIARQLTGIVAGKLNLGFGVYVDGFDANDKNDLNHYPIVADSVLDSEFVPTTSVAQPITFPFVAAGTLKFSQNLRDAEIANPNTTLYKMFFTNDDAGDNTGRDFDTANAMIVWGNNKQIATDIDFNATGNTIATQGAVDFSGFSAGEFIEIVGSTGGTNDGFFEVATANATSITTVEGLTTQVAGPSVTIVKAIMGRIDNVNTPFDYDFTNNDQRGVLSAGQNAPVTIIALGHDGAEWVEATGTISAATGLEIPVNAGDELNYSNPA